MKPAKRTKRGNGSRAGRAAARRSRLGVLPGSGVSLDAVRAMALAIEDVEEGTIHGAPAFRVRGKLLVCPAIHKSAEPDSLAVRISIEQREHLITTDPKTYYLTDHYLNYAFVLVRLSQIRREALRELLEASRRFVSTKPRKTMRKLRR